MLGALTENDLKNQRVTGYAGGYLSLSSDLEVALRLPNSTTEPFCSPWTALLWSSG
jgi:hypothetical protein